MAFLYFAPFPHDRIVHAGRRTGPPKNEPRGNRKPHKALTFRDVQSPLISVRARACCAEAVGAGLHEALVHREDFENGRLSEIRLTGMGATKACANYHAPKLVAQMPPTRMRSWNADYVTERLLRPPRAGSLVTSCSNRIGTMSSSRTPARSAAALQFSTTIFICTIKQSGNMARFTFLPDRSDCFRRTPKLRCTLVSRPFIGTVLVTKHLEFSAGNLRLR